MHLGCSSSNNNNCNSRQHFPRRAAVDGSREQGRFATYRLPSVDLRYSRRASLTPQFRLGPPLRWGVHSRNRENAYSSPSRPVISIVREVGRVVPFRGLEVFFSDRCPASSSSIVNLANQYSISNSRFNSRPPSLMNINEASVEADSTSMSAAVR